MEAVSKDLYGLVTELQSLEIISSFALAGGTSLAIRYNHRVSDDIDLFANRIIGRKGFEQIAEELKKHFKTRLRFCELINIESGDQYCFLRTLINRNGKDIKVEFIQNIQLIADLEIYEQIRILSAKDIGVLKLLSASSRKAKKDIYDLDLITEEISLAALLELLEEKQRIFDKEEHKCLFDLDNNPNLLANITLLLEFDNINYSSLPSRPSHANDRIVIISGSKSWQAAKLSWRRKVRGFIAAKGIPLPKINPIN